MGQSPSLSVNPDIIRWAREESGHDVQRVAGRLAVKEERILAWERGERQPTQRQLESLARYLHRPLGVFFLARPPRLRPLAAEYRRLPGIQVGHESPELRLALRMMIERRERALELLDELGEPVPRLSLRARLSDSPEDVGAHLRAAMAITTDAQLAWANVGQAWAAWRASAESMGVLVFQFPRVPLEEVRGLALLRTPLPVVAINSKEGPESRGFTLFHEIVHLMLAAAREEVPALEEQRTAREWMDVERFAEAAASHALVPEELLGRVMQAEVSRHGWDIERVRGMARRVRISPLAMATRLRSSGHMSWPQYHAWREAWDDVVSKLPARKAGFATPVETAISRAGRTFAALVLEALSANRITSTDAARYLGLKFEHFSKLSDDLRDAKTGRAQIDE